MLRHLAVMICGALLGLAAIPAQAQSVDDGVLTYEVRQGDTLIDLAEAYFRRPADYRVVQRLNRIADPRRLQIGTVLDIPVGVLRSAPITARVVSFRGEVTLTRDGARLNVAVGTVVEEGDLVETGPDSRIQLEMPDGSRMTLPSQSRARLARLRRYPINGAVEHELDLERGRAESQAAPVRTPGGYRVRTPVTVSAVRGTEFRVGYDTVSDTTSTTVLEGAVAVADDDDALIAGAGQGVSRTADGDTALVTLLAAPGLTRGDDIQTGAVVRMTPEPVAGAGRYRLQLAADAGFIEGLGEREVPPGEAAVFEGLADQIYFARISAITAEGVEGRYGDFTIIRARNGLGALEAELGGLGYRFRWTGEGEGDAVFRFQLRRADSDAPPLIDEDRLTEPELTLTHLPEGVYEWRVQSTRHILGRTIQVWSEPRRLTVGR